jgi:caa(3)-type oxidase subunit IV
MSSENHDRSYIAAWGVLLVAMIVSLVLAEVSGATWAVATIFVIAAAKAWLVVSRFMHLSHEPRFLKLVMAGASTAVACFFVGVYGDVALAWSVLPPAPQQAVASTVVASLVPGDAGRGAKVYATYCVGCHGADGRANGGTTGASFVDDPSRLAQDDEVLLRAISEGKTGKIGMMPPWKGTLQPQQMADVLAYLRADFGAPR